MFKSEKITKKYHVDWNDFYDEDEIQIETLRFWAASYLNVFQEHFAASNSGYVFIEDLVIRFSDHSKLSKDYPKPDFNAVNRYLTKKEMDKIKKMIKYPEHCLQRAFSWHVGLTVPKLKKILPPECYERVVLNPMYPNTETTFIRVESALSFLESKSYTDRFPVRQEVFSHETYY